MFLDFVLVNEERIRKRSIVKRTLTKAEIEERRKTSNLEKQHKKWRGKFMRNLRRQGILIEEVSR